MKKFQISLIFLILINSIIQAQTVQYIDLINSLTGTLTYDVAYSVNKNLLFSYGNKKLVIFDASTSQIKYSEDISDYGQLEIDFKANMLTPANTYLIVDETQNNLYFVTPDKTLKRLNYSDPNNIVSTIVYSSSGLSFIKSRNILRWDNNTRRLYWSFKDNYGLTSLKIFNISQTGVVSIIDNSENLNYSIYDISFINNLPPYNSYYYLSLPGKVLSYNISNPLDYKEFNYDQDDLTVSKFFTKTSEMGYNRLFCLPYGNPNGVLGKITVINTQTNQTVQNISGISNVYSAAIFENTNDLIFANSPVFGNDIKIYDTHNYTQKLELESNPNETDNENMCFSMTYNNSMYLSKKNQIIKLSYQSGQYSSSIFNEAYSNYFNKGVTTNNNELIFINQVRSGLEKFGVSGTENFLQTGTFAYESMIYPDINKVVFYSKLNHKNSTLVMVDLNDYNDKNVFNFDDAIGGCIYNKFKQELILVTYTDSDTKLFVYNTQSNTFIPMNLNINYCGEIFISDDKKLIISSDMNTNYTPKINVYNAMDYNSLLLSSTTGLAPTNGNHRMHIDYAYNESLHDTYFTIFPFDGNMDPEKSSNTGVFGKITSNLQYIELSTTYTKPHSLLWGSPDYRAPSSGNCYFIDANKNLIVWQCKGDIEATQLGANKSIFDIEQNAEKTKIYALTRISDSDPLELYTVDYDNVLNFKLSFGNYSITGLDYNPYSYEIIAYSRYSSSQNTGIYVFDPEIQTPVITYQQFDNKDFGVFDDGTRFEPKISFDTQNNKMFIPNGAHSNISVVDYLPRERLELYPGTNWLSIPRNQGNSSTSNNESWPTESVMNSLNFENDITALTLEYYSINPSSLQANYEYSEFDFGPPSNWNYHPENTNQNIFSVRGYKLDYLPNPDNNYLYMTGNIKDPETDVQLYENNMNWVGYFLPETQDAFDAISSSVLGNLTEIWTKNFYCYKRNGIIQDGPTHGDVSSTYWVCDKSDRSLHYADMVVLTSLETTTFQWNNSGLYPYKELRPEVSYYSYEITGDYTPIIIEFDYTENPLEIGAFIDTLCVGSVALLPEDTAVILKAYLNGSDAEDVVFKEYYGTKSTNNISKNDYSVYNSNTGLFEQKPIKANDGGKMIYVSFKNKNLNPNNVNSNVFNIWPNPVNETLYYDFALNKGSIVDIIMYDLQGNKIMSIFTGFVKEGYSNGKINLNTNDPKIKPGVYLIKCKIGNKISTKKLIVI